MNKTENDEQYNLGNVVQLPESTMRELMDIVDNIHDDVSNTKELTRACYTHAKDQPDNIAFVMGLMCQHYIDLDKLQALLLELAHNWVIRR